MSNLGYRCGCGPEMLDNIAEVVSSRAFKSLFFSKHDIKSRC